MDNLYYSFNSFLRQKFGCRVHKLSLHAGFACPNIDGTKDSKGCIFCNNEAFSHFVAREEVSLEMQIKSSMDYARRRFKAEKFIAYFQSYTNTYGDVFFLKEKFEIIRKFPDIVGLAISTRPDCIDKEKLDMIEEFSEDYMVWLEYGLQTVHNKSLEYLNRNHTYQDFLRALDLTRNRNIFIGAHVILGIPGEQIRDMIFTAKTIASLPLAGIKFHCLHVVKGTALERMYQRGEVLLLAKSGYIRAVCKFLEIIPPEWVILRLVSAADREYLVAPSWMNQKQEVIGGIEEELRLKKSYQGSLFKH